MTADDRGGDPRDLALRLASDQVLCRDPEDMASRAGGCLVPAPDPGSQVRIRLDFLGRPHEVVLDPSGARLVDGSGVNAPHQATVVVLHYLATASGGPPSGRDISFKEIKDGHLYYPNFEGRVLRRLTAAFGDDPSGLLAAARPLDGRSASGGDAAVCVPALPRVPLTFIVWGADEEFEARAAVLFDASVGDYLPAEDTVVLCEMLAGLLSRARSGDGG